MISKIIIVTGKVQGVGFRYYCYKIAKNLNLFGYAENLSNGNVEIMVEGEEKSIDDFINLMKIGPRNSDVKILSMESLDYIGSFKEFSIR